MKLYILRRFAICVVIITLSTSGIKVILFLLFKQMSVNVREKPIADLIIIRRGECFFFPQGVLYHGKLCPLGMGHIASHRLTVGWIV